MLGDNPFFGIYHLSQEQARQKMKNREGFGWIAEIVEYACSMGVKKFVASTHPELRQLIRHMGDKTDLLDRVEFCPIFPYVQGYVQKTTEKGMAGAARDVLSGMRGGIGAALGASVRYLKRDAPGLVRSFVDFELESMGEARYRTVFLHDVVTDLCLGLGLEDVIVTYADHARKRGLRPGVVTKNFPLFAGAAEQWGVAGMPVMTSFNPSGWQMNPSKKACEDALKEAGGEVIAMNALAGGLVDPSDAAGYLSGLGLGSVVVGVSTKEHARESIGAFQRA